MKKVISLMVCLVLIFTSAIQVFGDTVGLSPTESSMLNVIDKNKAEIFDISTKIWNFKELGNKEFKSSALLEDSLAKQGFTVQRGVTGIDPTTNKKVEFPTAFIATFEGKKNGPTIGIMVEYDALPKGHACAHNLISAAGYAAALGIKEALKTVPGKVVVYGTPAEETSGSKVQMLAAGLMKNIDVMYEVHADKIWSTEINVKAMVWPKYEKDGLVFTGKSSHASIAPAAGRSALDAAMLMGIGIEFLREHMVETDRIHYVFVDGGKAANVVPDRAQVDLMVRANTTFELKDLMGRVDKIIAGAAMMTNATAKYEWDAPLLNANPAPALWRSVAKSAAGVGMKEDMFVVNIPAAASTDAGNVGYEVPMSNISFPLAATNSPDLHTSESALAANTDYAKGNSLIAGKIIALNAYKMLTNPQELKSVKADFAQHKK